MKIPIIFTLLLFAKMAVAQSVVSTAGATATMPGYQLSWTVGEPVISTYVGSSRILTQGFHQSKLIVTSLRDFQVSGVKLTLYPNPLLEKIFVKSEGNKENDLRYSVLSTEGRLLQEGRIESSLHAIDMQNYSSGSYLLRISKSNGKRIQVFKVIKQ